jgi:transposase-like protein
MAKKKRKTVKRSRRTFTQEFKLQAVQMLLDGYHPSGIPDRIGAEPTRLVMH